MLTRSPAAQLEALRHLFDAGAFLRCARPDKRPIGLVREGYRIRSGWNAISANLALGGHILYYQPGAQGLMILDFDPMLPERLDTMSAILGNHPYRSFPSSGNWKPAEGSRPAGYGGHAVWAVDPALAHLAASIRGFSDQPEGDSFGEAFTGHPMFGVVVWDAIALAEAMEVDPIERVDPRKLFAARYSLAKRNPDGTWEAGEGSRHDAAVSESVKAATWCPTEALFNAHLASIKSAFEASFSNPAERIARMRAGEWDRIEAHSRAIRPKARREIESLATEMRPHHEDLIAAIRKRNLQQ